MTKYRLTDEMRSQSEVTLTSYMVGSDSITNGETKTDSASDNLAYDNSKMDLNGSGNQLKVEMKTVRSNSCTCTEKGKVKRSSVFFFYFSLIRVIMKSNWVA